MQAGCELHIVCSPASAATVPAIWRGLVGLAVPTVCVALAPRAPRVAFTALREQDALPLTRHAFCGLDQPRDEQRIRQLPQSVPHLCTVFLSERTSDTHMCLPTLALCLHHPRTAVDSCSGCQVVCFSRHQILGGGLADGQLAIACADDSCAAPPARARQASTQERPVGLVKGSGYHNQRASSKAPPSQFTFATHLSAGVCAQKTCYASRPRRARDGWAHKPSPLFKQIPPV